MARPRMCRRVGRMPDCVLFKPAGIPTLDLQEMTLTVDELESLRLADLEGLYHQEAAEQNGRFPPDIWANRNGGAAKSRPRISRGVGFENRGRKCRHIQFAIGAVPGLST